MIINYQYEKMLNHADQLEKSIPFLLYNGSYMEIQGIALVSEDIWSGKAADAFNKLVIACTSNFDAEMIRRLPDIIRDSVSKMKVKEKELA